MFIAVDGIDGAGKTTLVGQLVALFGAEFCVLTKEPTNLSPWGKRLRASAMAGRLSPKEEIEYFHQDRLFHIAEVIQPALDAGKIVICDRYVDSTLAFQTDDPTEATALFSRFAQEILQPDITFILDCPVETAMGRIGRDRAAFSQFEKFEILQKAKRIYDSRIGGHYVHLDASGDASWTLSQAIAKIRERFSKLLYRNHRIVLPSPQGERVPRFGNS